MKLTVIRGLPGSGKSTYAKKNYDCLILENDMFQIIDGKYLWSAEGTKRAVDLCVKIADMALANGSDVVIANTFTKKKYVYCFFNIAKKYGAEFEVIRMDNDFGNIHNVPDATLKSMKDHFDDWIGEKTVSENS